MKATQGRQVSSIDLVDERRHCQDFITVQGVWKVLPEFVRLFAGFLREGNRRSYSESDGMQLDTDRYSSTAKHSPLACVMISSGRNGNGSGYLSWGSRVEELDDLDAAADGEDGFGVSGF